MGFLFTLGTHFETEERYFDQFGYPGADSHKKEHSDFAGKVSEFKGGFEKGKLGLSIEVMNFLSDWLQHHIKSVDKKYGPFFNAKGLKFPQNDGTLICVPIKVEPAGDFLGIRADPSSQPRTMKTCGAVVKLFSLSRSLLV